MKKVANKNINRVLALAAILCCTLAVLTNSCAKHSLPRIVVILPSPSNPFWIEVSRGADQMKAELKGRYEVDVQSSLDMDASSQNELLNAYLDRNTVDALVLGPASDSETVPTVAKYSALHKPIVLIDTELNPSALQNNDVHIDAFIGSDNVEGGKKAANGMFQALQSKKGSTVLVIEGSLVHQSAIDRTRGFF